MFRQSDAIIQKLSGIKHIITDFDGVFYKEPDDIYEFCDHICAQAAMDIIPGLENRVSYYLAKKSYEIYKNATEMYVDYVKVNNPSMNADHVRLAIFERYHARKWITFLVKYPELLKKHQDEDTAGILREITQAGVEISVLSHACAHTWVSPFLNYIKVDCNIIRQENIHGGKESGFKNKQESAEAIGSVITQSKYSAAQTAFVEDSLANLQMAKAAYPDLLTILVSDKQEYLENPPSGVDIVVPNYFYLNRATHYAHVIAPIQGNQPVFPMPRP